MHKLHTPQANNTPQTTSVKNRYKCWTVGGKNVFIKPINAVSFSMAEQGEILQDGIGWDTVSKELWTKPSCTAYFKASLEKKLGRKILWGSVLARSLELSKSFPVLISVMLQFWTSAEVIVERLSLQDKAKKLPSVYSKLISFQQSQFFLKRSQQILRRCSAWYLKGNKRCSQHVFPYVHTCICLPASHPHDLLNV